MIFGYFVYMEGTVCNQIIKRDTNSNIGNIQSSPIKYTLINLSTYLSSISPITFIISSLVFIYSLCLIYGIYSLN